jgi:hypothetical protein
MTARRALRGRKRATNVLRFALGIALLLPSLVVNQSAFAQKVKGQSHKNVKQLPITNAPGSAGQSFYPTQEAITAFPPVNVKRIAVQEALEPSSLTTPTEIRSINAPKEPPERHMGVPIVLPPQEPGASPGEITAPTPSSTGVSPGPVKTFKGEFLSSTSIPPDTMGAVGTTHVVTVSNDRMRIQTRDGVEVSRMTITSFWTGVTIKGAAISAFDTKVYFDRFNNRFIMIASGNGTSVNSGAMFAVTATADPTGTWYRWSVAADPASTGTPGGSGNWIDYPTVGFNKNWIVVNENVFHYTCNTTTCSNQSFWGQQIYVLDKGAAYANTLSSVSLFAGDFTNTCLPSATPETELACGFTMAPAITEDNTTDPEYLVEDWDSQAAQLRLSKFTGTPSAPVLTVGTQFPQSPNSWRFDAARINNSTTATTSGTITSSGGYMPQRQQSANLTSGTRMMANDSRIQNSVLRNNKLWCAHTVMLSATAQTAGTKIGGSGNPIDQHTAVQWWQIDPTNETGGALAPLQRARIEDSTADNCHNGIGGQNIIAGRCTSTATQTGTFFAFPNISVNKDEDVLIGFTQFSPLTYSSAAYAIRRSTDAANTMRDPVVFRPGQANYNIGAGTSTATYPSNPSRQNRWGDYSSAQTDPLDDTNFWTVQEYAGTVRDFGIGLAGNWETWWAQINPGAASPATTANLIISEFRLRGPQGVRDEYVELYNPNSTPVIVSTTDNSDGWALAYSTNGTTISAVVAVVPNGTVIPAHGHFLIADNPDAANGPTVVYSLNSYPSIQARGADSDTGWSLDLADNGGLAIFKTANSANFSATTVMDSAGFGGIASGLFKEGSGIPAISTTTPTGQMTFYRDLTSGVPKDTGANENDFVFADPAVETLGSTPRLGAAGPKNLDSPINRSDIIKATSINRCVPSSSSPNRERTLAPYTDSLSGTGTYALGTLDIRHTFVNTSSAPVTRLRFRIVELTTLNSPGYALLNGQSDLRALSSPQVTGITTCSGTTTAQALTLETPPAQPNGGGDNSTLSAGTITLDAPLGAGATVGLNFRLGVKQSGSFRFFIIVEALP